MNPDMQLLNNRSDGLYPVDQYPLLGSIDQGGTFERDSVAWYFDSNGNLVEAAIDEPRFNYVYDGTLWKPVGLLLEGEGVNYLHQSRTINVTPWVDLGTPIITYDSIGIDGVANSACTLEGDDGAGVEGVYQDTDILDDSNTHVFSVFIKKDNDETRFPALHTVMDNGVAITTDWHLNTKTGAVANEGATGSAFTEDYGDWWRMSMLSTNDGSGNTTIRSYIIPARGTVFGTYSAAAVGSIVVDQAQLELDKPYPTSPVVTGAIGATVVTNGDFADWTGDDPDDWTLQVVGEDANNYVAENPAGQCQIVSDGVTAVINYQYIRQNVLVVGNTYRCSVDVKTVTAGSLLCSDETGVTVYFTLDTAGVQVFYFKAVSTAFIIKRNAACNVTIDDVSVSVMEVRETEASNSSDLNGAVWALDSATSRTGLELVINGDFSAALSGEWKGPRSNEVIVNGELQVTATANYGYSGQEIAVESGKTYQLTFDYYNTAGDTAEYSVYDATNLAEITNRVVLPDATSKTSFGPINVTMPSGCVLARVLLISQNNTDVTYWDNVSLKEVLPQEPQNIVDMCVESLSDELIVNGDMTDASDWTIQAGWTVNDVVAGKAHCDGTQGAATHIYQSGVLQLGAFYKVVFTITNYVSGTLKAEVGNTTNLPLISANGTYTYYGVCSGSTAAIIHANVGFEGEIDDVSYKEVFVQAKGTLIYDWTPHYDSYTSAETIGHVSTGAAAGQGYQTDEVMKSYDGSQATQLDITSFSGVTTYRIAVRWGFVVLSVPYMEIGVKVAGTWSWDATPAVFDGAFPNLGYLRLGHTNEFTQSLKNINWFNRPLTQTEVEIGY